MGEAEVVDAFYKAMRTLDAGALTATLGQDFVCRMSAGKIRELRQVTDSRQWVDALPRPGLAPRLGADSGVDPLGAAGLEQPVVGKTADQPVDGAFRGRG